MLGANLVRQLDFVVSPLAVLASPFIASAGESHTAVIGGIEPPLIFYSKKSFNRITSRENKSPLEFLLFMGRCGHLLVATPL